MPHPRPVMLVILDGWGWREEAADNAVRQARTPCFDTLWATGPHAFLRTSGPDVGLPAGQMGNSEVGHLNLGAGRVVMQDLPRIDAAVADGSLAKIPQVQDLIARLRASGGTLHLMGLLSPGGVHSHQDHALALARIFAGAGIPVAIHAWTDGRDTPPNASPEYLAAFEPKLPAGARIVTLCGRYYAMDRDNRWERVKQAWDAMALGQAPKASSAAAAIETAHATGKTDEFIPAAVIGDYAGMRDGDALLCFNFRADRVRQIMTALVDPQFKGFERPAMPKLVGAAGMTQYSTALDVYLTTLFPPQSMQDILGAVVSAAGKRQMRMAETEKYPHVTYFFNGGGEVPFAGEERVMVPSPKVATYDLQPEMSAPELAQKAVEAINSAQYDLIVLNFANADMVGHTGSLEAATKACEVVDAGLARIVDAVRAQGGALLVTADHGNAELMRDPRTGGPHTAHTTNKVPVVLVGGPPGAVLHEGRLADVAPTLLALMGLPQPAAMTGRSLIGTEAAGTGG
ncbi:2,3-bisphosphoglycerate-independent phosphoglycerate mutase [Roseomonas marmotae]|uniref:2,3-bisphosphoglycerate-independent phosphoglycerate mutase n=1 Tax=Roseomonas marmotae TaxID=2768161 RepID=A0ABS3K9I3_9PROT|nr:2,3-bisphosphoglycerate-independent phosphoglycerate mutase [Roseomonas marmotae]MBO1074127.1 2,3-bisphosphoglycerate-independent phosphoglycerate mutase [Roseomonas marmotae]QTI78909.1 2,3-bisphosphoglycerate-independent phosphoglycerate mutase [Roseomonas marmotae]